MSEMFLYPVPVFRGSRCVITSNDYIRNNARSWKHLLVIFCYRQLRIVFCH